MFIQVQHLCTTERTLALVKVWSCTVRFMFSLIYNCILIVGVNA